MKKKVFCGILMCIALLCASLCLFACGGSGNSGGGNDGNDPPPAGHTHTIVHKAAQEPTCVKNGNTEYWSCSGCGKYFADADGNAEIPEKSSVVLNATGIHKYNDGYTCVNCGQSLPFTKGLTYERNAEGTGYTVTGLGEATDTDIVIPAEYKGLPVTNIGDRAFEYCSKLKSITISNSVTSIGNGAFGGCSKLTSITISNSVTSIGYWAFCDCSKLTSITIPNSVTSIESVFSGCSSLTSITIPESVTNIKSAFKNCSSLTSITIPDSITNIGSSAFENCSSLTNITIPDSVTSIGDSAFFDCSSLTSITIPDSVTSIGGRAFEGCSSLKSITISDSVTSIGSRAFYNTAYYNDETNWENNVLYIGKHLIKAEYTFSGSYAVKDGTLTVNSAFNNCRGLTSITIPNSVTSIGSSAFYYCSSLTNITIPNSVTSIGSSAFYYCSSLTSIQFQGTKSQWQAISKDSMWNNNTGDYTVTCTDGTISKVQSRSGKL